jgi:hypothetical protein
MVRRRNSLGTLLLASTLVLAPRPVPGEALPRYLEQLYHFFAEAEARRNASAYAALCRRFGISPADSSGRALFLRIHFFHDLLTGSGAADGLRGGFLGIPYFWHWTDPNPRHRILSLPDSIPLRDQPPPRGLERYASFADVDRIPSLFLGDLFAERPRYAHPETGPFYTFGWCSEREMAFLALMTLMGYTGRIVRAGIHVWTELLCTFPASEDSVRLVARVDNTFGTITWARFPEDRDPRAWQEEAERERLVRWYNHTARSPEQLGALRRIVVGPGRAREIREAVAAALASSHGTTQ